LRRLRIETEARFDLWRNLDGSLRVRRRRVCYRNDGYEDSVGDDVARHDDDAGPVLKALFLTGAMLARPQIGIADDEARVRIGKRQAGAL
jgi:hypothetical protein